MDFFGKMGETLSTKGKDAAQKAKDVAELAKLNAQAGQLEGKIKTWYQVVGEKVYQMEKDQDHAGLEEEFTLINDAVAQLAAVKKQIAQIKGIQVCPACKAEVNVEYQFCPKCGEKLEKFEIVEDGAETAEDVRDDVENQDDCGQDGCAQDQEFSE